MPCQTTKKQDDEKTEEPVRVVVRDRDGRLGPLREVDDIAEQECCCICSISVPTSDRPPECWPMRSSARAGGTKG